MDTPNLSFTKSNVKIGIVYTPVGDAYKIIERFGLFSLWMNGKSIYDPTMGEGNLIYALIRYAQDNGYTIQSMPINNLFGNEINSHAHKNAIARFRKDFNLDMSRQFTNKDILEVEDSKFDVIFGNPPWQNFNDLPTNYKSYVKPYFKQYGLVNGNKSLLGNSRVDLSALIIKKVIQDNLSHKGIAVFYLPLSIFLNDGAHEEFRKYDLPDSSFSVDAIIDYKGQDVFENISTRYGVAKFTRDSKQKFPIKYETLGENGNWKPNKARPLFKDSDPLNVLEEDDLLAYKHFHPVVLEKSSLPRQGLNTCGANSIFFFNSLKVVSEDCAVLDHKYILPRKYIKKLVVAQQFKSLDVGEAKKWVLLPYKDNGRPLELEDLKREKFLFQYLSNFYSELSGRKGTMINAWIRRGYWWALLGVGPYNFSQYKVIWEAYGKKEFRPKIFHGEWQANQSLQAFIPLETRAEADRVLNELSQPFVERYLLSLKMEGTMNWAQPGKIKKLIKIKTSELTLF